MTPVKIALATFSLALLVLVGVFAFIYWPDDAYDAGYGKAYEQGWSSWALAMPPSQACDQVVHDVLAYHGDGNGLIKPEMGPQERQQVIDRIHHGCESGFYDAVEYRRGQLGLRQD